MNSHLREKLILGLSRGRGLLYTLESVPLPLINSVITGTNRQLPGPEKQQHIIKLIDKLLKEDAKQLAQWPLALQAFTPESPTQHFKRLSLLYADSITSSFRRRTNRTTEFSKNIKNLEQFPEYYRRNFHHQTDGYLSEKSAMLYEHQVEVLFRGMADPMRRRILTPLVDNLDRTQNLSILEVGCGTGTLTQYLSQLFPNSRITAIDLSPQYIQYAKKRFSHLNNVDFMVGQAEDLPFQDKQFDAVVSVFLHHELPRKVREAVMDETHRVCKKQGIWALLDSLQLDDDPELNWALEDFPKTFHEPFYTNYIKNPLQSYLKKTFSKNSYEQQEWLLSKVIFRKLKK